MLSLVLPTYNESANVTEMLPKLSAVMKDLPYEIIVVDDDSPDRTWEIAERLGVPNVRVIRRVGRKGLSSAIGEGFEAGKGAVLAVMDADGQHDANILPQLYAAVIDNHGMAVGSRYVAGGSVGQWNEVRYLLSRTGTTLAQAACRVRVKDPMSGYFAIDAALYRSIAPKLHLSGFKVLLEVLANIPKTTIVTEVPFLFGVRTKGYSKLSFKVQRQFLFQLLRLLWQRVAR